MEIFNSWQFNLVLYFVAVITFYQSYKFAVRNAKKDGAAIILLQLIAGASILLATPFFHFAFPSDFKVYIFLAGACIFYAMNDRLELTSRKNLSVSTVTIARQLSTVILIVYGLLLFQEPFVLSKTLGGLFVILGNVFIFYKRGKLTFNKYIFFAFLATFCFATAISIDVGISNQFNLPFYIMLTLVIPAVMIALIERMSPRDVVNEVSKSNIKFYLLTGISWGLTILFSLRSFQLGSVTQIAPLQATTVVINVILAYFIYKEKDSLIRKIIASVLVVIGVTLAVVKI